MIDNALKADDTATIIGRGVARALVGGAGSMLAGGKFAYGAQTATMDYLFNELAGRWGASYD